MRVEDMQPGGIGYVDLCSLIAWGIPGGDEGLAIDSQSGVTLQYLLDTVLLSREPDGSFRLHIPRNAKLPTNRVHMPRRPSFAVAVTLRYM